MKVHEYRLPAPNARPRRIALAPDGTIYYTDFARGYLGHFDPVSGKLLKEWASPGGAGSEPYGIAVTGIRSGTRWPGTQSTSPIGPATSSPLISTVAGSCVEQDLRLRQVPGAISRVSPAVDRDQLVIETFSVLTRNR